jgi:prolyl-tRNA editing enzyme YbaK/EbsC (Cys-tRNA(Pro) deacylase)
MKPATHRKAKWVQTFLGSDYVVLEFDEPTASAQQAASAIGCSIAQIAKSLVFKDTEGRAVLVIASGANRVNTDYVAQIIGSSIERPGADFVKQQTGFSIGGIPPVGHTHPLKTVLDQDLQNFSEIWAAAGTPNAVFKLTPQQLQELTQGPYAAISA